MTADLIEPRNPSPNLTNPRQIFLIGIEGLLASGKTTLLSNLSKSYSSSHRDLIFIVPEALDLYTNFKNQYNPLEEMYSRPDENIIMTQIHLARSLNQRIDETLNLLPKTAGTYVVITDRCLFSPEMFIKTYYVMNLLSEYSKDLLLDEIKSMAYQVLEKHDARFAGMIYLDTTIPTCMERMKKRNRPFEKNISENFLSILKIQHEEFFCSWKYALNCRCVIKINGNADETNILENMVTFIGEFLEKYY